MLRERRHESVAEVCGAVEIDEPLLQRIESGRERPSEDILLLLLSHFDVQDEYAAELWQLAGYTESDKNNDDTIGSHSHAAPAQDARTQAMMIMIDPRVMYSDNVEIVTNKEGIVINFGQTNGVNGSPLTVSRIGMSHAQARDVLGVLHQALYDIDNPGNRYRLGDGGEADAA